MPIIVTMTMQATCSMVTDAAREPSLARHMQALKSSERMQAVSWRQLIVSEKPMLSGLTILCYKCTSMAYIDMLGTVDSPSIQYMLVHTLYIYMTAITYIYCCHSNSIMPQLSIILHKEIQSKLI